MNTGKTHFKKGITPWNKGKKYVPNGSIIKVCEHCGVKYPSRNLKSRKYCSPQCLNKAFKRRRYYESNYMKEAARRWKKMNPEKVRISSARCQQNLTDGVVRALLKKRNPNAVVTPETINKRRVGVTKNRIKRVIKKITTIVYEK